MRRGNGGKELLSPDRSNVSLYDLSLEGVQIQDMLLENDGELTPELEARIDQLMLLGPEKIEAAAIVVQNLQASALVCTQEALRLKSRAESFDRNVSKLKERIAIALDCAFNGKVKTHRFTVWTQKAPDTVAFDLKEEFTLDQLEATFPQLVRTKKELDKKACQEAFKAGDPLPNAIFVEHSEGKRYARIK